MRKHNEILSVRADEKVLKALGKDVAEELDTLGPDELKSAIVASLESMSEASEKLAGNPVYQDMKARLDDVVQGKKLVDAYQGAKIKYARQRLREMGKLGATDKLELEAALLTAKRVLAEKRTEAARAAKEPANPRCLECNQDMRPVAEKGVDSPSYECYRCETLPKFHAGKAAKAQAA